MRADQLRLTAIGVFPIKIDYDAMFAAHEAAMEDRVEEEILASFGGHDAMVQSVETEMEGKRGMTAAEMIVYLRSLGDKE